MTNNATSFPQQIGLAASFEPELGREMGHAIAAESRACGIHETYSPVMDLIRDPRYGRAEESYGEDTHLCAEFARETVRGMQGTDLTAPDAVAAEPKHYVGYGNPVGGLNCAPCTMGRHDVFSDCLPVFEAAFADGKACDAMCSYNSIDSIPVSMDHELLTDVLRGQFGMPGFVRSDLTAVSRLYDWHFIAETPEEAIRLGLEAGVDLQLYDFPHDVWQKAIAHLIESGSMKMSVLDTACRRVLRMKFALGLFENPYTDEKRADKILRCPEHLTTAEKIAEKSIVLLKNDGLLPIRKDLRSVAVIGPAADTVSYGDYTETRGRKGGVSVLDGIRAIAIGMVVWFHFWQQTWLTPYLRIPTEYTKYIGITEINLAGWVRYGFIFVDMMILLSAFCNFLSLCKIYCSGRGLAGYEDILQKEGSKNTAFLLFYVGDRFCFSIFLPGT